MPASRKTSPAELVVAAEQGKVAEQLEKFGVRPGKVADEQKKSAPSQEKLPLSQEK